MPAEYESPTDAQFLIQLRSAGSESSRRSSWFAGVLLDGMQCETTASDAQMVNDKTPMFGTKSPIYLSIALIIRGVG
jgi:hypothetical protein